MVSSPKKIRCQTLIGNRGADAEKDVSMFCLKKNLRTRATAQLYSACQPCKKPWI